MDNRKIIALLKNTPIFAKTSEKSLESMIQSAVVKTVPAGEKVVEEGQGGVGFYLILEGKVDVIKDGKKLAEFEAGNFFGELGVIDGKPRTADVVATAATKCWILSQWAMKSVIASHPEVALSMLEELARRLRATGARSSSEK
ncbi:cyclic nucleotide-binding domain-containing protein [Candidatus Bipolaricaulota bacterium]|jgi:CRP-like cAMP-binding protein|nr:cyclic nucleotide-binding domain-containing protein [Candidatus Bipolaricaulota bacterium]TFH09183.1 MAG: cyclic nucleotide-binding domain-containing protein [Candidatus Atribacteria bacterium]